MGGRNDSTPYLKTPTGEKVYSDVGKTELLRNTWSNTVCITQEENRDFDPGIEIMVREFLRNNLERTIPYTESELSRLDINNPLTRPLEICTIKISIKNMKDKSPGNSGIRKSILEKMLILP